MFLAKAKNTIFQEIQENHSYKKSRHNTRNLNQHLLFLKDYVDSFVQHVSALCIYMSK